MSDIRSTTLTTAGLTLLAKCQTGKELHFERVTMGNGKIAENTNIKNMTAMVSPMLNLPIKDVKLTGVGTTVMETELKNDDLKKGFFAREVGIFAKDPDDDSLVLYAYRNTGDDSEYIPAGGGSEMWNLIYDVVTVVDQAENVTATINGDVAYISRVDFYEHRDSTNPHPNAPSLKSVIQPPSLPSHFWAMVNYDKHLHPISLDDTRTAILGDSAATLPLMRGRINQLETELANVNLKLLMTQELPDSNLGIYEDFKTVDQVDDFKVRVTAATAGSNAIEVQYIDGIYPGAWYWITDGVHQEQIQVKSAVKTTSGLYRILAKTDITNTYNIPQTYIYRTTAGIANGAAFGSSDRKGTTWQPTTIWAGAKAAKQSTVMLESTLDKADTFTLAGDTKFTSDGFMTLDTTVEHSHGVGIALIKTGGTANGTNWVNIDDKGNTLTQSVLDKS